MEIRPLTPEEEDARLASLGQAKRLIGAQLPFTVEQVQVLYDEMRSEAPDWLGGQIALGTAFGELILLRRDWEWVRVVDEYGSETSLSSKSVQVYCHPISMLQKRLADAETWDIAQLLDGTIESMDAKIASGEYAAR